MSTSINWVNSLFLIFTPILAIALTLIHVFYEGMNWWLIIPFVILYFLTGLSITAGYHRLLSHKAYQAHPVVKLFYLVFGAGAFENSALNWCHDHRIHHRHCDSDKDPYNIERGFWYAHMGWIMLDEKKTKPLPYPKDLLNDPYVMFQHHFYLPLALLTGLLLPLLLGFIMGSPIGGLAIAGFARIVFVHHMTFFINSLCHIVGTQPYTDKNSAKDSPIMALFSYGEGYHNFHHLFQNDYRNGIRWYHFDPTKWLIATLAKLKLASRLKKTPAEDILRARMYMIYKKQIHNRPISEKLQVITKAIDQKLRELVAIKKQWQQNYQQASEERQKQWQEKMHQIRTEVRELTAQWAQEMGRKAPRLHGI